MSRRHRRTTGPKNRGQKSEVRSQRSEVSRRVPLGFPMIIRSAKELIVYQKAFMLAIRIKEVSCRFPRNEDYALTSQIRRSSRSVCLNLREAWAKRRYRAHFISKLTDCDGENSETDSSLDFAVNDGYISEEEHRELTGLCMQVGKMLGSMIQNPDPFVIPDDS
jgi:four helix bundle protein